MSPFTRETYLSAVVQFLGHRQSAKEESVVAFLGRHATLWSLMLECWDQLAEREGAPSPDQVFSWL